MGAIIKWVLGIILIFGSIALFGSLWGDAGGCIGLILSIIIIYVISENNNRNSIYKPVQEISNEYFPGQVISTHVAGVTFNNRQSMLNNLNVGDHLRVYRDYENKFDENAIGVFLRSNYEIVGYIPRELAAKIAKFFDRFDYSPAYIVSVNAKVIEKKINRDEIIGIRITFNIPTQNDSDSSRIEADLRDRYF